MTRGTVMASKKKSGKKGSRGRARRSSERKRPVAAKQSHKKVERSTPARAGRAPSGSRARAMVGGKPVSMALVANAFSAVVIARSAAASLSKVASPYATAMTSAGPVAGEAVSPPPIPAVFPCRRGDRLHCTYTVANAIVAESFLFLAPDENGDGVGDRIDELDRSPSARVSGTTQPMTAGWSYLVWDFHPADKNPWTATLSISVNGGPALVFQEQSGNEATHHQAGMLIWADPNA
jgi:hypothetical protein